MKRDHTAVDAIEQLWKDRLSQTPVAARTGLLQEQVLAGVMAEVGVAVMERQLQALEPDGPMVDEAGRTWRRVLLSTCTYQSRFGILHIERGLYRCERAGPTRCFVDERFGILDGRWTPEAARLCVLLSTDLSSRAAARFLQESGGMSPSKSSLVRLCTRRSQTWEAEREAGEAALRRSVSVPTQAVTVAVMLDGVMVHMPGPRRKNLKAAARRKGRKIGGPIGDKEASVGALVFYDAEGERLQTRRFGRMPEHGKHVLKQILTAELAQVRGTRPDLVVVAISDGAPNNWSFLESLNPDHQVVDFYHTVEHVKRRLDAVYGVGTRKAQSVWARMRRQLLEPTGHPRVFAALERLEKRAKVWKERKKRGRGAQPTFYERHHGRMDYASHRAAGRPIGSGVIEGTCRFLVVDRLRRTGMRWSQAGGQAILNFRQHAANDQFNDAWNEILEREARYEQTQGLLAA